MMAKGKSEVKITSSLEKLHLPSVPKILPPSHRPPLERAKCRSLLSLCLGVLGKYFEDIMAELNEIAVNLPPNIKMMMLAIARRRNLLDDEVLIALAEKSWEILDISGSKVSDFGLAKVAELCNNLRAIDISCCSNVTTSGVSDLLVRCHSLDVLRWGGCARSDSVARRCLSIFMPNLNIVEGESWEELDSMDLSTGVHCTVIALARLDDHSKNTLATECPRIVVNPKPSPFGFRGVEIPHEAFPSVALDEFIVQDIDPQTWAIQRSPKILSQSASNDAFELSMAERFRLAFVERDARLAPKRAKNARQHRRRADREWVMMSADAKSILLASQARKFLHN